MDSASQVRPRLSDRAASTLAALSIILLIAFRNQHKNDHQTWCYDLRAPLILPVRQIIREAFDSSQASFADSTLDDADDAASAADDSFVPSGRKPKRSSRVTATPSTAKRRQLYREDDWLSYLHRVAWAQQTKFTMLYQIRFQFCLRFWFLPREFHIFLLEIVRRLVCGEFCLHKLMVWLCLLAQGTKLNHRTGLQPLKVKF